MYSCHKVRMLRCVVIVIIFKVIPNSMPYHPGLITSIPLMISSYQIEGASSHQLPQTSFALEHYHLISCSLHFVLMQNSKFI